MWGSQLQIYKTGEKIDGILLKYAPCCDEIALLRAFVHLAAAEQCVLYAVESKKVYAPCFQSILDDLKASKAVKFMQDPKNTILESAIEAN